MAEVPKVVLDRLRAQSAQATHPDADVLTAFAEQSLTATERERVLTHLAACGDCREVIGLSMPATEAMGHRPVPEPKIEELPEQRIRHRPWFAWPNLRWAALATAAVVVASALWLRPNKPAGETIVNRVNQEAERPAANTAGNAQLVDNVAPAEPVSTPAEHAGTPAASPPRVAKELQAGNLRPNPLQALNAPQASLGMDQSAGAKKQNSIGGPMQHEQKYAQQQDREYAFTRPDRLGPAPAAPVASPQTDSKSDVSEDSAVAQGRLAAAPVVAETQPVERKTEAQNGRLGKVEKAKSALKDEDSSRQLAKTQVETRGNSSNYAASTEEFRSRRDLSTWRLTDGSLQRSLDAGVNWETVLHPDQPLLCQAVIGREIWVGGKSGLLLHSPDSGITWTVLQPKINEQVLATDVLQIVITRPGALTLSTASHETWKTVDNGVTWVKN